MKQAKIQWLSDRVRVYDPKTGADIFWMKISKEDFITKLQKEAAKHGRTLPQIYAGNDGIVRIWL